MLLVLVSFSLSWLTEVSADSLGRVSTFSVIAVSVRLLAGLMLDAVLLSAAFNCCAWDEIETMAEVC